MSDLPKGWDRRTLHDIGLPTTPNINPSNFSEEIFELYSVPTHTVGTPEIVSGSEIGSTKQIVQSGDVLLCKINPHIVRVWCIPEVGQYRQIASGEWIVVRPKVDEVCQEYVYYGLIAPAFRSQFLENVSGVGGSLMRARPKSAAQISIPLPPLATQRRIVAKLDALFARSQRARAELAHVSRLAERAKQAVLAQAFSGELTEDWRQRVGNLEDGPWLIPSSWRWGEIADVAEIMSNLVSPTEVLDLPHIAPNHIESGVPRLLPFRTVREDGVISAKHRFSPGQIIYSKIRPYLRKAVLVDFQGVCSADMYPIQAKCNSKYLLYWLISPSFTDLTMAYQGRTVLPKINQNALYKITTPIPPIPEQEEIAYRIEAAFARIERGAAEAARAAALLERMEQAALAKAFRGELVE